MHGTLARRDEFCGGNGQRPPGRDGWGARGRRPQPVALSVALHDLALPAGDEQDLLAALESGKVAGVGLDVYENEPTPSEALLKHPQVSCTPHIGASTVEAQSYIGMELADKIIAFFGDDK